VVFARIAAVAGGISRTEGASVIIAVGWISLERGPVVCSVGATVLLDDSGFRDPGFSFATASLVISVLPQDGLTAVLSAGFWLSLSEWFETLSEVTTRLRTVVESLFEAERLSLERRSLVWVCAAAKVETASKKASRRESLFILTLNSEVSARFIGQGTGHRVACKFARPNRGLLRVDKELKGSGFRKIREFMRSCPYGAWLELRSRGWEGSLWGARGARQKVAGEIDSFDSRVAHLNRHLGQRLFGLLLRQFDNHREIYAGDDFDGIVIKKH
jgi:hypothetical protein